MWAAPRVVSPSRSRWHTRDRKSTRLNSSHVEISYAVFCLKKKKKKPTLQDQTNTNPITKSQPCFLTSISSLIHPLRYPFSVNSLDRHSTRLSSLNIRATYD